MGSFFALLKTLLLDRATLKFAIGVILGMAFSISVILCTIGLMDGYSLTLKKSLQKSEGHISLYSRNGFFKQEPIVQKIKDLEKVKAYSGFVQTEAFLVYEDQSLGVSLRGIDPSTYQKVTGLDIKAQKGGLWVGKEFVKKFNVKIGDQVVLMLASGNQSISGLPLLKQYKIEGVVTHGVYEKDLRYLYSHLDEVKELLGSTDKINIMSLRLKESSPELLDPMIDNITWDLEDELGFDYIIKPYWSDFESLLKAVEVEKINISIILQIIVIVSMFNLLAFVVFLTKSKSQQLFLYEALGLSKRKMLIVWLFVIFFLWLSSCFISFLFVDFFDFLLKHLSLFKLPSDVYHFGNLSLLLELSDYLFVFSVTMVWLVVVSLVLTRKIRRTEVIHGLREEFQ